MSKEIPAVLTPFDVQMGLHIARSLGERGIHVYGIDSDAHTPAKHSKYCRFAQSPEINLNGGQDYVQFLVDFGKKLNQRAVLFPLSDESALICSQERERLSQYYEYVQPDHETLTNLTTKNGLDYIANKYDIPAPQTVFIQPEQDIEAIAENLKYPVILKPTLSAYWRPPEVAKVLINNTFGGWTKAILCHNAEELVKAYRMIAAIDNRLIVQEVILGEDSRLVYFAFYFDRTSQPLGIFAGRKNRVLPTGFGSASYVRSMYDPALKEIAFKLLNAVGYKGLGGVEFKQDVRDGQYKLVEFNPRFGMWDGLGKKCGVDLGYLAYADAIGQPIEPILSYRENIIWVDWQRDLRAMLEYRRDKKITVRGWLRSLKGEKMWAVYDRKDWRPGVAYTLSMGKKILDRII